MPLMAHQVEALKYSLAVQHPFLCMEMRMGKCRVAIRRCKLYKPQGSKLKVLIVAPYSALAGWESELNAEGETDFVRVSGTRDQRLVQLGQDYRWYLVNKECFLSVPELDKVQEWDAVIVDESHCIKNPKAEITKYFLTHFRRCPHRWALTGTPNGESNLDLYCQFAWLSDLVLNNYSGIGGYYRLRESKYTNMGFNWTPNPGTEEELRSYFSKVSFIRRRKDVNTEPVKVRIIRKVQLPQEFRNIYDTMEDTFSYDDKETIWATTQYQWLRQLAGGFLDHKPVWSGKIEEMLNLIEHEIEGPYVVWFQYNQEIAACCTAQSKRYGRRLDMLASPLDGTMDREDIELRIKDWREGRFRGLFIQQAIAQTGMDLSHASTAIFYSMTPSVTNTKQIEDRIVNLKKPDALLYVYLTTENTVDEDLYDLILEKKFTSDMYLSSALRQQMKERRSRCLVTSS